MALTKLHLQKYWRLKNKLEVEIHIFGLKTAVVAQTGFRVRDLAHTFEAFHNITHKGLLLRSKYPPKSLKVLIWALEKYSFNTFCGLLHELRDRQLFLNFLQIIELDSGYRIRNSPKPAILVAF